MTEEGEKDQMLTSLPIFTGVTGPDLDKISRILEERHIGDNIVLFGQGDVSDAFYIIKEGAVRVLRSDGPGAENEIAVLSAGDFFGEMGIIDDAPRSATVVTKGETTLLVIAGDEFLRMLAVNPSISRAVMSAIARRAQSVGRVVETEPDRGRLIGLFSVTGGVGTTFIAANLAGALKRLTKGKILVFDLDFMFGDQAVIFDVSSRGSIDALAAANDLDEDRLLACVLPTKSGVDIIQAPEKPENAEAIPAEFVVEALSILRKHYDYIVCDTDHVVNEFTVHVLESMQVAIYAMTSDFFALKNAKRWFTLLKKLKYPVQRVKLLVNRFGGRDADKLELIRKSFGREPLAMIPCDTEAARESIEQGTILSMEQPGSPIGEAICSMAAGLSGISIEPAKPDSFWSRWIRI